MSTLGALLTELCDDAALFPPGNAPLDRALPAHAAHRVADHAELVGTFVFPAPRIPELVEALGQRPLGGELTLSLTVPGGPAAVVPAMESLRGLDGVAVAALEIAVPADETPTGLLVALDVLAAEYPGVALFVEIPRDERRAEILQGLVGSRYAAKFRTGGVVAEAYPDEQELAEAVATVVRTKVPFKATAGLHHAVRNTDPHTGFEQHGFLNVLAAVDAALDGADTPDLAAVLADRNGDRLAARLGSLTPARTTQVRNSFRSFGTCSIAEPLVDLIEVGLAPSTMSPITEGSLA
ncbi:MULTISPECIES: hypothetical protein [unclassified Rhodococcus (in: high G+C Gram-positive bacteria)]|uniref:hypothetical protein n=1 Tax=unclassified Rhodococcus (in: high G+C Gram-positive bacteria) TaxID=192944 RepID=UPI0009280C55|nr:hypothetical protein [Rhodococcus sp. M8]OLL19316.1 hypothetical protein BKE56_004525 [Rhodococcus sp. M8]QPG43144.1 hypothetical protein ISO16_14120 [Rhodococcus sp. M8]